MSLTNDFFFFINLKLRRNLFPDKLIRLFLNQVFLFFFYWNEQNLIFTTF